MPLRKPRTQTTPVESLDGWPMNLWMVNDYVDDCVNDCVDDYVNHNHYTKDHVRDFHHDSIMIFNQWSKRCLKCGQQNANDASRAPGHIHVSISQASLDQTVSPKFAAKMLILWLAFLSVSNVQSCPKMSGLSQIHQLILPY